MKSSLIYIITALALLGLNLVAGLLLINASNQNQVSVSHLEALNRNQQNFESLQQDLDIYSAKTAYLAKVLPKEISIPDFIQFIADAALQVEAAHTLNFTSDLPTQTKDKLWSIPLSISLSETTPTDLEKFINLIKSSTYQLRFNHLEVSFTDKLINARINGSLFVSDQFSL